MTASQVSDDMGAAALLRSLPGYPVCLGATETGAPLGMVACQKIVAVPR